MEFTGNELLLAHNIKGGLIKLANLMDYIIENGGGTGGNGLKAVGMDVERDATGAQANFQIKTTYDPEGYQPALLAHFAFNTDKVRVRNDGYVQVDTSEIPNNGSIEFQIMTVADGYARVKFFILSKDAEGKFKLYDNNEPFSGA